jgi:catechol 2,3-dioxygenase-like lactoylglutathione lyase family enzyme
MTFEHVALNLKDYREAADWYCTNLGMTIVREKPGAMVFLADEAGTIVLELYANPEADLLNAAGLHPLTLHLAFAVDDVVSEAERLLAAGCTLSEQTKTVGADTLAMLRDPFGVSLQLVHRG